MKSIFHLKNAFRSIHLIGSIVSSMYLFYLPLFWIRNLEALILFSPSTSSFSSLGSIRYKLNLRRVIIDRPQIIISWGCVFYVEILPLRSWFWTLRTTKQQANVLNYSLVMWDMSNTSFTIIFRAVIFVLHTLFSIRQCLQRAFLPLILKEVYKNDDHLFSSCPPSSPDFFGIDY